MGTGGQRGGNSLSVKVSVEGSRRQRGNPRPSLSPDILSLCCSAWILTHETFRGSGSPLCGPPG